MLEQIKADLKSAMQAGEKAKVTTLRGLIAAIQSAEIDKRSALDENEILKVIQKESKKRTEAAEMYTKGGSEDRASQEMSEKAIIDAYLPTKLSTEELEAEIDAIISEPGASSMAELGKVIGATRAKRGAQADGGEIAKLVKQKLS